jgi:DNA-directed RNA polymerase subunit RPC12/RpoP
MSGEVNFACPTCGAGMLLPIDAAGCAARCPRCEGESYLAAPTQTTAALERCAHCASRALFVQRDFNRKLGLAIVALAALVAVPTWGISLLVAALVDLALYRSLPRITVCYECDAIHRGIEVNPQHGAFDHEVAEEFKEEKSKRQVAIQRWLRERGGHT